MKTITPRQRRRVADVLQSSPGWREQASCQRVDTSLFHADDDDSSMVRRLKYERAKQTCSRCPVRRDCLVEALLTETVRSRAQTGPVGVWGGTTPKERGRDSAVPEVVEARQAISTVLGLEEWAVDPLYVDWAAVLNAVETCGEHALNAPERTAAVALCMVRGWTTDATAEQLGMGRDAVLKSWERTRDKARAAGEQVPDRPIWVKGTTPDWATAA